MPFLVDGFFAPFLNVHMALDMKYLNNDFGLFLLQSLSYGFRKPGMSHFDYFYCAFFFLWQKTTTIL